MISMVVLYRKPDDPAGFEKRYIERHLPLIGAYQNIKDFSFHRVSRTLVGEFPYSYVFRGIWADKDGWKADLNSEQGKAATVDAEQFAKDMFDVVVLEQLA